MTKLAPEITPHATPRIAVIIASKGRPEELGLWTAHMRRQSRRPDLLLWAVTGEADLPERMGEGDGPLICISTPGLCAQRNAALRALPADIDLVAFFDDDYVPSSHCLAGVLAFFATSPGVVGASGRLLADGINSRGISIAEGLAMVQTHDLASGPDVDMSTRPIVGLYGCNMVFRRAAIQGEWFDENLPLYGWQEDVDFARRIERHGKLCGTNAFIGVHLGSRRGRVNECRLGYSQVSNMLYLIRKGSMPAHYGLKRMVFNMLANHARAFFAEPWIDRIGRAKGNWLALGDLLCGRITPQRVLEL
jgi:hypothetical protein